MLQSSNKNRPSPELLDLRRRIRHSAAHLLADAVLEVIPAAKLTIGPPTDDGFYYDFDLPRPVTPEDLERLEGIMRQRIKADLPFVGKEVTKEEAAHMYADQRYKLEILEDIPPGEKITLYSHGKFTDLCRGGHVDRTGQVSAIKLLNVAGAYWRGDEHNPMLQRIYGTAFESQSALNQYLKNLEEAQKRDHRKLGIEMGLFVFNPIAPASPFFLPKGTALYNALVEYARGLYKRYGYSEVITPQIFETELWKRSGHYQHYIENMYVINIDEREYGVKPMNCPAHALMFGAQAHSYRDLPVRFADFGRLHRYERSGVTHGLTRVRTFAQDDAHIFCRPDQVEQEIRTFVAMLDQTYKLLRFEDVRIRLSLRPEGRIGTEEMWDRAEKALANSLTGQGLEFEPVPGEGAFYGPKIDFLVADALGREWQLGTLQLDYNLPERFDLDYTAEDGSKQRPVVLHRAMFGSIERFLGVMIEHFGGAFPVWLAPVQARVVPIADRHSAYAEQVRDALQAAGIRAEVDSRSERMQAKIRDAQLQKIPYMLVAGDREAAAGAVAVRMRSGEDKGAMPLDKVKEMILKDVVDGT
ncbi:MAG: threonine--tRNA ligase [Dehalococcoidia bacterium]|nr:threonine--tRNA ligase [Dehalococcoidia bacterium]